MNPTKMILVATALSCMVSCSKADKVMSNDESPALYSALAGGGNAGEAGITTMDAAPLNETSSTIVKDKTMVTEQKLIKNGSIAFETKSLKETKAFLQKTVSKYKGYISNEQIQDYKINPTEILVVRVPNADFDKLINEIGGQVGEFDSKQIDIDDVTAEFVDIEARLKNKKQLEGKYQELLARAGNMADILKIEKEISIIREDIEATEGRMRYLSNQVGFSTLNITYYEHKATAGFHFGGKMSDALAAGGMSFLWFIIGLTELWPTWLIIGIICFCIYKVVKRRKNRKLQQKTIQQN